MDPDDVAYRKSVRNMSLVLAAMVIVIFAALFLPPYVFPPNDVFQASVSMTSAFGFTLHLEINTTSSTPRGEVLIMGWLNSTSSQIDNITASDFWGVNQSRLWPGTCTSGWPIGLGVMAGHYNQDNYTLGTLIQAIPTAQCPKQSSIPGYFLLEPLSSKALVVLGGTPQFWVIQSNYTFGYAQREVLPQGSVTGQLQPGVYTVILADEWGDVLTTNFQVT